MNKSVNFKSSAIVESSRCCLHDGTNKNVENTTPILQGYQNLKCHYPNISVMKEEFFQSLSKCLPSEDPEIQSSDGLVVDVLWDKVIISITENDALSITANGAFKYFECCLEAIDFIKKSL